MLCETQRVIGGDWMIDQFGRRVDYMRISVTDRCNLRCLYCMPEEGVPWKVTDTMMQYDEILRIVRLATELGIRRVRITGGEPLVRRGLVDFMAEVKRIPGIEDLSLSTNGLLFAPLAAEMRRAGLDRINISLDSLRPERFDQIARTHGGHDKVWAALAAAEEHGLNPIKINCVAIRGFNGDEFVDFARLTLDRNLHVRFIELMPLGDAHPFSEEHFISAEEIRERLRAEFGGLEPARLTGAGPAKYMRIPGARGTIGFITAMSECFCGGCNRVRLSADGQLNPCLGSVFAIDLRHPMRNGATDEELRSLIALTILRKPEQHHFNEGEGEHQIRMMSAIGG